MKQLIFKNVCIAHAKYFVQCNGGHFVMKIVYFVVMTEALSTFMST